MMRILIFNALALFVCGSPSSTVHAAGTTRVTCSGEFSSGSGRAGSTLGNCHFQADTEPERVAREICATQIRCSLNALEQSLPSGYALIVKVLSPADFGKPVAPGRMGAEAATEHLKKFFRAYLDKNLKADLFGPDDVLTREFFTRSFIADYVEGTRSDEPVIDANIITGRQEGSITRIIKYWTILYTGQTAVVGVSTELTDEAEPPVKTIETHQYLLVRNGQTWQIDDMTQDPKEGLSIRGILRREIEGRSRRAH